MRRLLLVLLLVASLLAGCSTHTGSTATGKSLLQAAKANAQTWQADAYLTGVEGVEMRNGTAYVTGPDGPHEAMQVFLLNHNDADVGDGRAPAWLYEFASDKTNQTYGVVVNAAGKVEADASRLHGNNTSNPHLENGWNIDSDAAWSAAKGDNATFRALAEQGVWVADSGLIEWPLGEHHPTWILVLAKAEHDVTAMCVDAFNGTAMDFEQCLRALVRLPYIREAGSDSQFLLPTRTQAETTVALDQPYHRQLAFTLTTDNDSPPGAHVKLDVTDKHGVVVLTLEHTRGTSLVDTPEHAVLSSPANGPYRAVVTLDPPGASGLYAQTTVTWCTDGISIPTGPFGTAPPACDFVDQP